MEYKCSTICIDKMMATVNGFVTPICQSCKTSDCENPIEMKKISIVGIKKDMRVLVRGTRIYFVVKCNGYTK